ncbi:hypothetical protein [Streptomyces sp. CS014]|uniref:hypothetical protein n=1 Tax=Streptomyces sp. CS014 TaxID=2162707 RepID=UPI000D51F983|nr:hypothetical protein [Streptomyces sp. CS014]PVD04433.1 hypothetical protein DBP12_03140 [Streptomyces sp. CS014]
MKLNFNFSSPRSHGSTGGNSMGRPEKSARSASKKGESYRVHGLPSTDKPRGLFGRRSGK